MKTVYQVVLELEGNDSELLRNTRSPLYSTRELAEQYLARILSLTEESDEFYAWAYPTWLMGDRYPSYYLCEDNIEICELPILEELSVE